MPRKFVWATPLRQARGHEGRWGGLSLAGGAAHCRLRPCMRRYNNTKIRHNSCDFEMQRCRCTDHDFLLSIALCSAWPSVTMSIQRPIAGDHAPPPPPSPLSHRREPRPPPSHIPSGTKAVLCPIAGNHIWSMSLHREPWSLGVPPDRALTVYCPRTVPRPGAAALPRNGAHCTTWARPPAPCTAHTYKHRADRYTSGGHWQTEDTWAWCMCADLSVR